MAGTQGQSHDQPSIQAQSRVSTGLHLRIALPAAGAHPLIRWTAPESTLQVCSEEPAWGGHGCPAPEPRPPRVQVACGPITESLTLRSREAVRDPAGAAHPTAWCLRGQLHPQRQGQARELTEVPEGSIRLLSGASPVLGAGSRGGESQSTSQGRPPAGSPAAAPPTTRANLSSFRLKCQVCTKRREQLGEALAITCLGTFGTHA